MSTRPEHLAAATQLSDQPFNRDLLLEATRTEILTWTIEAKARRAVWNRAAAFLFATSAPESMTVQQWWTSVEPTILDFGSRGTARDWTRGGIRCWRDADGGCPGAGSRADRASRMVVHVLGAGGTVGSPAT